MVSLEGPNGVNSVNKTPHLSIIISTHIRHGDQIPLPHPLPINLQILLHHPQEHEPSVHPPRFADARVEEIVFVFFGLFADDGGKGGVRGNVG